MCAIAGILGLGADQATVDRMLNSMRRRGPDANGTFFTEDVCLLHTRLAVIDPHGGCQPMIASWGGETYTIVYNGEIYNAKEIRDLLIAAGHRFLDRSDTEVVLHAYAQWGESCVHHLNGIFAFAVYEKNARRLFLARDRMGVKPLFYMRHLSGLLFASEMKTILEFPTVKPQLDAEGAAEILLLGPGRTPGCGVFRNMYELEPGCCAYYQNHDLLIKRYWKLTDREHTESYEETVAHVQYLVTDSIKRQMVSDVPLGTFLSGGLDSSIISSVCAREKLASGERLKTFSVDYIDNDKNFVPGKFQPNSDNHYIGIMRNYLGSDHRCTVLSPENLIDALEAATRARDLPGMADVDFSLLAFCGEIRTDVTVALSGECADEIFGGYPWYRDPDIRTKEGFPWAQNTKDRASFLTPDITAKIDPTAYVMDRYKETLNMCDILPGNSENEVRIKQMINLNHRWFMQTLLDRKDRMSMYHGLEVRVPFCDYRIAEYMYAVPWEFKEHNGQEKGILRQAMADYLPIEIRNRKKSPYPKTYDPKYQNLVEIKLSELLQEKNAPLFQLVNREALKELFVSEYKWPWYGQLMRVPQTIAYMLQINYWLTAYNVQVI